MTNRNLENLSDREREVLRLLARGHETKSIAAALHLSVHTVNERLRAVRRKLGVSSSREAARRLQEHEAGSAQPKSVGHKEIGVASPPDDEAQSHHVEPGRAGATLPLIPLAIGCLMITGLLLILTTLSGGGGQPTASGSGRPAHSTSPLPALFAAGDYPAEALAAGVQGSTRFRLRISDKGRVERCDIEQTSGSAALDQATCRVIMARARFFPAIDSAGRAVDSVHTDSIRWMMKEQPATPTAPSSN